MKKNSVNQFNFNGGIYYLLRERKRRRKEKVKEYSYHVLVAIITFICSCYMANVFVQAIR